MDRLLRIGFQSVGYWELDTRKADKIVYFLRTAAPHPHTLYAFVVDAEVMYVGKTTRTLAMRMDNYMGGVSEREPMQRPDSLSVRARSTNARIGRSIRDVLRSGAMVEIYALPDGELHRYGDFHLNLAAGLEDSIIAVLRPAWNGGALTRRNDTDGLASTCVEVPALLSPGSPLPSSGRIVQVKLGATYWDKGFFNIGVDGSSPLGTDGQTVEIYCGDHAEPVLGSINRRANLNGTPRIFGGKRLREWVQANMARDALLRIEVLMPTAIRLSPAETATVS